MRKQTFLLPGVLLLAACFFGCKKESSQTINPLLSQTIDKVNTWLDAQTSATDENKNDRLQALRDKLEFTGLRFEELNRGEKLIVVPVKAGLETLYNKGEHPATVLLLVQNAGGAIRKGNLVQYIPGNGQTGNSIPANTFFKLYNEDGPGIDGKLSFLNLTGRLLYEMECKDGQSHSFGIAKPLASGTTVDGPPQDPIGPAPACIDWYLVTTYYYADGTTEETEEYLYTTCENSGGGGGGEGNEVEENVGPAEVDWIVDESPTWRVWSIELLSGIKVQGEPAGGHFTSVSNKNTLIEGVNYNWTVGNANMTIHTVPQIAFSNVSGLVKANNNSWSQFIPTKHRIFLFSKLFP